MENQVRVTREARQGDVRIDKVNRPVAEMIGDEIARDSRGRLVLAASDSSAHAHVVTAKHAKLFAIKGHSIDRVLLLEEDTDVEVDVNGRHGRIPLTAGAWRVSRQREVSQHRQHHLRPVTD